MKPWEKYAGTASAPAGAKPWEKYGSSNEEQKPEAGILDTLKSGAEQLGRAAIDTATGDPLGMRRVLRREKANGALDAFRRGAIEGGTFGFSDELAGVQGAAEGKNYTESRDEARNVSKHSAAENPISSTAGNLTGGFAAGGGVSGGASVGARVLRAGLAGGVTGAGTSEADTAGGVAVDAGLGAGAGIVLQGGAEGLQALSPVGRFIQDRVAGAGGKMRRGAEDLAVRHLRPTPQNARVLGKDKLRDVGREALDSGAIEFGARAENTAANLDDLVDAAGAVKGDIVENSPATINSHALARRIRREAIAPLEATSEGKSIAGEISNKKDALLGDIAPTGRATRVPVSRIENEKMAVDNSINWGTEPKLKTGAVRGYAGALRGAVDDAIDDPAFTAAKRAYGNLETGRSLANRTASLTDGGLMGHITDVGIGTEVLRAGATGNPSALALAGGRALTKGRISSSAAVSADKVGRVLERLRSDPNAKRFIGPLEDAARRGGSALSVTHYIMSQRYPEYRKLADEKE